MPNLGDYIGQIVAEITIARMQGDIAALRIAEQYATNDYLKYLPVPRFRIPNIEIDMPIVIKKIMVPKNESQSAWNKFTGQIKNISEVQLRSFLSEKKIIFTQKDIKNILNNVNRKCDDLAVESDFNLFSVANHLSIILQDSLRESGIINDSEQLSVLKNDFVKSLRSEFVKLKVPQVRLEVQVSSAEVKEAGSDDVLTHLHLKINEEGFEWTTIEIDGIEEDRLVLE